MAGPKVQLLGVPWSDSPDRPKSSVIGWLATLLLLAGGGGIVRLGSLVLVVICLAPSAWGPFSDGRGPARGALCVRCVGAHHLFAYRATGTWPTVASTSTPPRIAAGTSCNHLWSVTARRCPLHGRRAPMLHCFIAGDHVAPQLRRSAPH